MPPAKFLEKHKVALVLGFSLHVLIVILYVSHRQGNEGPREFQPFDYFVRVEKENMKKPQLLTMNKIRQRTKDLPADFYDKEKALLKKFEEENRLRDPLSNVLLDKFPVKEGTRGFVTTCKLNAVCLTALALMHKIPKTPLPIELWLDKRPSEATLQDINKFVGSEVTVRELQECTDRYDETFGPVQRLGSVRSFSMKLKAIVCSSFEEVVWVDGDAWLTSDVDPVLAQQEKQGTAFAIWRDTVSVSTENPIWSLLDTKPVPGVGSESGMLVANKKLGGRALYLAAYLNQRQSTFYRFLHGDKDTFLMASKTLGIPYFLVPYVPASIDDVGLLQPSVNGRPQFAHITWYLKRSIHNRLEKTGSLYGNITFIDPNTAHFFNNRQNKREVVIDYKGTGRPETLTLDATRVLGKNIMNLHKKVFEQALEFKAT